MANDETTKHAGWMPSNPSMDSGSGGLAPDCDGLYGDPAGSGTVKSSGQTMGGTPMHDSGGVVSSRIMDTSIEYDWPGSNQGNLEPVGGGRVRGA